MKAAVPLVGQPIKLIQHYHTFIVQCECPAKTISVIIGNGPGVACPGCGGVPAAVLHGEPQLGFGRSTIVTEN